MEKNSSKRLIKGIWLVEVKELSDTNHYGIKCHNSNRYLKDTDIQLLVGLVNYRKDNLVKKFNALTENYNGILFKDPSDAYGLINYMDNISI